MIRFKQKINSFLDDVRVGAELGAAVGSLGGAAYHKFGNGGSEDKKARTPLPKFLGKRFDKTTTEYSNQPTYIYKKDNNGLDMMEQRQDRNDKTRTVLERVHEKEWVDRNGKVVPNSKVKKLSKEELSSRGYQLLNAVERNSDGSIKYNKTEKTTRVALTGYQYGLIGAGAGIIIGATLGALAGVIKLVNNKFNRKITVDARLLKDVTNKLKRKGFIEGKNFTKDPKRSTDLKSKVCIAITRSSGELKLLVNVQSDPKLNTVADDMISNIKNSFGSTVSQEATDKFNDIKITNISNTKIDSDIIVEIATSFIKAGYPVYLVEVG